MTRLGSIAVACAIFGAVASSPGLSAGAELDLTSAPKGVLPPATLDKLWNAYKTAKECFAHPHYDPGTAQSVPTLSVARFREVAWHSPFTDVRGAKACTVTAGSLYTPAPLPKITLDEAYGQRVQTVDVAESWFRRLTTYVRLTNDPLARKLVKQALLDWASNKSLGKGIHVSGGSRAVDYQVSTAILALLTATAEVADDLTADDRAIIGPWLNDLMKQVGASHWQDREDNKAFMRAYMVLLWGLIIGDDSVLQDSIDVYKLAIHDMRPDGSWPIDSQRGGMGVDYNGHATGYLVLLATALKTARNLDLFDYSVDGRSIHTAVDFVAESIKDPSAANRKYAIPCPHSGDRWGTIEAPNLRFVEVDAGYLLTYAAQFPGRDSSKYLQQHFSDFTDFDSETAGGVALCQFASAGGEANLPPLQPPPPKPELPKPTYVVTSNEEYTGEAGHSEKVGSLFSLAIADGNKNHANLHYNIAGRFSYETGTFSELRLILNDPLDKKTAAAMAACGANVDVFDGKARLDIDFAIRGDSYVARKADCIIAGLPAQQAFLAKFLLTSFRDVAIGLVADDSVSNLRNDALQIFFRRVALGEITVGMAEPPADMPKLPKPTYVVTTREEIAHTPGHSVETNSLMISSFREGGRVHDTLAYNIVGTFSFDRQTFSYLRLVINDPLGKTAPPALTACGGITEVYDDGQHRAAIEFEAVGDRLVARHGACIIKALPDKPAFLASFLLNSFRDVAIGIVADDVIGDLKTDALKIFFRRVALGEITVGM